MTGAKIGADYRRSTEYSERSFAESLLGRSFEVRIYARHGGMARGTVKLNEADGCYVHTAYISGAGDGVHAEGTAVGVLVDRVTGSVSVMLDAAPGNPARVWTQSDIAEAVDYWECQNALRIWCLNEKSCGAVVYTGAGDDRKYLIIRMHLGHCGLPKGHIEKFESERETALREVREETGVAVTLIDGFRETVVYSLTPRTTKESVYFLGRFDGESIVIQPSEVSAYRLCPYEEARTMITYENDRAVLDAAHRFLEEHHDTV
jgi:ADP-ribose pyrophosphatase YjhB (NUDIX family)